MRQLTLLFLLVFSLSGSAPDLAPYRLKSGKWTFFDRKLMRTTGKEVDEVIVASARVLFVREGREWIAMDGEGKLLVDHSFGKILQYEGIGWAGYREGLELYDFAGKTLISGKFAWAEKMRGYPSRIILCNEQGRIGVIDSLGKIVMPFEWYHAPEHLREGFIKVFKRNENGAVCGLMDEQFHLVLPYQFVEIGLWQFPYVYARDIEGHFHVFDYKGNLIWKGNAGENPDQLYKDFVFYYTDDDKSIYQTRNGKDTLVADENSFVLEEAGFVVGTRKRSSVLFYANGKKKLFPNIHILRPPGGSSDYLIIQNAKREDDESSRDLENVNRRQGIMNLEGKKITDLEFSTVNQIAYERAAVCRVQRNENGSVRNQHGLLDLKTKKMIVNFQYEQPVVIVGPAVYALYEDKKYQLYAGPGKKLSNQAYTHISPFDRYFNDKYQSGWLTVKRYVKEAAAAYEIVGAIDQDGKELVPCEYTHVSQLKDRYGNYPKNIRRYQMQKKDPEDPRYSVAALADENYKLLTAFEASTFSYWNDKVFAFTKRTGKTDVVFLTGLMSANGKILMPAQFEQIDWVADELIVAKRGGKYGIIGFSGKELVPFEYERIMNLPSGYYFLMRGRKYGLADPEGKVVLPCKYALAQTVHFDGELFLVKDEDKGLSYYVDRNGTEFIER